MNKPLFGNRGQFIPQGLNYLLLVAASLLVSGLHTARGAEAQNLLTNGNFDSPDSAAAPAGWKTWTYANTSGDAWVNHANDTNAFDGTRYMQVGSKENGSSGAGLYQVIPGEPGYAYGLSVESRSLAWWWPQAEMRIFFLDASNKVLSESVADVTANIADFDKGLPWTNYTLTAVSPRRTAFVKVEFASQSGTGTVFFDKALLTNAPSSVEPPPDGTEILSASSPYGAAVVMRNIPYLAHPTPRQNFDLYLPQTRSDRPFPLIVWIHGGAWLMGIKDWDNVKYLVRHGYAIASVDYRLSTEARFPAQIQDCNTALNFILAHAREYGVDPRRFVVGGASAGGHLALLLGLARHERDFEANPSIKPLAVLDMFGPADLARAVDDLKDIRSEKNVAVAEDALTKLLGAPPEQSAREAKAASPLTYVSAANPPVLILHGGRDDLVPVVQSRRLHEALTQAGVKNQLIIVENAGHDGPAFATPAVQSKVIGFLGPIFANP